MKSTINHAAEAYRINDAIIEKSDWSISEPYLDRAIAMAHVHATLALADQQRVANIEVWYGDSKMPKHLEEFCIATLGIEP